MCCAHLGRPLKDKCWVHREAPTSSGLKEFSDCNISKSDSWKEQHHLKMRLRSVEVHFASSISSFQEQEMESISQKLAKEKKKERKNKCNFALGSLNYLHVTSESFSFLIKPRQCPWNTDMVVHEERASSGFIHLCICWYYMALKSLESPCTFISFWCVWISACLLQHSCCMKRSRLGCFISCLSLLQLN